MRNIKLVGVVVVVGFVGWLLFGFFGVQALFTDRIVDEVVPIATKNSVVEGALQQGDSTYTIAGTARVTESNGVRTLSLVNFEVTNGPDLFVYLVTAPSTDNGTVKQAVSEGKFINLGELKGNKGNQTYVLPDGVVVGPTTVVSIWCQRFARNFGSALLADGEGR